MKYLLVALCATMLLSWSPDADKALRRRAAAIASRRIRISHEVYDAIALGMTQQQVLGLVGRQPDAVGGWGKGRPDLLASQNDVAVWTWAEKSARFNGVPRLPDGRIDPDVLRRLFSGVLCEGNILRVGWDEDGKATRKYS
jgi:hypothetical protein